MRKSTIYKMLRISNDINAIMKGKIGKRIMRRMAGRFTGRKIGGWFN